MSSVSLGHGVGRWQRVQSLLVGAAVGAICGLLVGGLGGRLAMLLLRLTSPDNVLGIISDDGFRVGTFSASTLQLLVVTTVLGAANGAGYAIVRQAGLNLLPTGARVALWSLFAAAVGGETFVHEDGLDFRLLEPAGLAVALFIALPGIAAALVAAGCERTGAGRSSSSDTARRQSRQGDLLAVTVCTALLAFASWRACVLAGEVSRIL